MLGCIKKGEQGELRASNLLKKCSVSGDTCPGRQCKPNPHTRTSAYLLGVDGGERVVEGPDDVMSVPGAGNDGTQSCRVVKNITNVKTDTNLTGREKFKNIHINIKKKKNPLTPNQDDDATSHSNAGLFRFIISSAGGALHSHGRNTQAGRSSNDAHNHEGTGCLDGTWMRGQDRVNPSVTGGRLWQGCDKDLNGFVRIETNLVTGMNFNSNF